MSRSSLERSSASTSTDTTNVPCWSLSHSDLDEALGVVDEAGGVRTVGAVYRDAAFHR